MWWKKKVSEVSTSEDDLDDSGSGGESENEDEDEEHNNGPTLVTVDDGKGGVKHIKVSGAFKFPDFIHLCQLYVIFGTPKSFRCAKTCYTYTKRGRWTAIRTMMTVVLIVGAIIPLLHQSCGHMIM